MIYKIFYGRQRILRIGILTFHFANNYGAVIQALSMQRVLNENFGDAQIINFVSKKQKSQNSIWENNIPVNGFVKNLVRIPHYYSRKRRIRKFEIFRNKYLNIESEELSDYKRLFEYIESKFDILVVGGDQVWNPGTDDFDDIYFWVSKVKIPVIAIAVSMGNAKSNDLEQYVLSINSFKFVGVREKNGLSILQKIGVNTKCKTVVDPTLLVDKKVYEKLVWQVKKHEEKPYFLFYFLGRKDSKRAIRFVKKIGEDNNTQVKMVISNNGIVSYDRNSVLDVGPEEFVYLIKHAKCVFTNSFHATVFSIRFGTPFYILENSQANDSRKKELLTMFGLTNRAINDFQIINEYDFGNEDILMAQEKLHDISKNSLEVIGKRIRDYLEK